MKRAQQTAVNFSEYYGNHLSPCTARKGMNNSRNNLLYKNSNGGCIRGITILYFIIFSASWGNKTVAVSPTPIPPIPSFLKATVICAFVRLITPLKVAREYGSVKVYKPAYSHKNTVFFLKNGKNY